MAWMEALSFLQPLHEASTDTCAVEKVWARHAGRAVSHVTHKPRPLLDRF